VKASVVLKNVVMCDKVWVYIGNIDVSGGYR